MAFVVAGNLFASPIYFAVVGVFLDPMLDVDRPSFWVAVVLGLAITGVVITAWWWDRAIGAAVQVIVLVPLIASLDPLPLRAWHAFQWSVFLEWRAYLYVLFLVIVPGGLLTFTAVSIRRWVR